jgi:hypothetical protein
MIQSEPDNDQLLKAANLLPSIIVRQHKHFPRESHKISVNRGSENNHALRTAFHHRYHRGYSTSPSRVSRLHVFPSTMLFLDMTTFKRTSKSVLIMLVTTVLITYMALVQGHSMLLVTSGRPKCMTVEVPGRTVIRVSYEAPGAQFSTYARCCFVSFQ